MAIQKTDSFLENPKSREFPSSSETCPYFDSDSNSDKNVHYLVSLHSMEQVANSRPFQSMYVVVQMGGYKVRSPSTARKSPEYVYPREPIRIALPPSEVDCEWSETPAQFGALFGGSSDGVFVGVGEWGTGFHEGFHEYYREEFPGFPNSHLSMEMNPWGEYVFKRDGEEDEAS